MNKKQLIGLAIVALLGVITNALHIGAAPDDITNGCISLGWLVYCLLAHDANNVQSILMQKTNWVGISGSIWWLVTMVFHVSVPATVHATVDSMLLYFQGYYTLNHSSVVHELKGTVGQVSDTFAPKQ